MLIGERDGGGRERGGKVQSEMKFQFRVDGELSAMWWKVVRLSGNISLAVQCRDK